MRHALVVILLSCALTTGAFAQQPTASDGPAPSASIPDASGTTQGEKVGPQTPPEKQPLSARTRNLLDDFHQRHQQRVQEMSSYEKAGDSEPTLKQFTDPRKVELELKDERDREQTSEALASEYRQEATQVKVQDRSLQQFLAKRHKILDGLSKRASNLNRGDLELAAANLARQPGTGVQVSEIRRRLSEADRSDDEVAAQRPQIEQEIAGAEEELKKVQGLEQSLEKEAKAYTADAASARQNQLKLADRLEFYVVRAKAEDVLDQDAEATAAVPHLGSSPEVRDTLANPMPSEKANAQPEPAQVCDERSSGKKSCAETPAQTPKEQP